MDTMKSKLEQTILLQSIVCKRNEAKNKVPEYKAHVLLKIKAPDQRSCRTPTSQRRFSHGTTNAYAGSTLTEEHRKNKHTVSQTAPIDFPSSSTVSDLNLKYSIGAKRMN